MTTSMSSIGIDPSNTSTSPGNTAARTVVERFSNRISTGPTTILDTRLTAGPDSRLMAADDSGTWSGVKNVVLPYTS